jgi:cell fate regulator YaaT (PSP1 superfamily)
MDVRYVVRYGATRHIGIFGTRGPGEFARGSQVVVRTDRGAEVGEVLAVATDRTRELLGVSESKGSILREMSEQDRQKLDTLAQDERHAFRGGQELIAQHKLAMQLVDVEQLFGGERLIFYYISENRIDFRELVKSLAGRFRLRIEMRQIGVRDEAKLLADYGDCGKPVCCNTHLREMPPVSMKMAKLQKATLDPTKISGRCGRLKCCLRYEYDTYEEYRRELPSVGAVVVTRQGQGKVVGQEILARKVLVLYADNRQILADLTDVLTVVSKGKKPPAENDN